MCRWLAYTGSPVLLEKALYAPAHSLIDQSLHSKLGAEVTNGDGFGVGWYDETPTPGVFRSIEPAWNDQNLRELAGHVSSGHFFAHIRAAIGSAVQQTNCHPFRHGRWLFMHNGFLADFAQVKRELVLAGRSAGGLRTPRRPAWGVERGPGVLLRSRRGRRGSAAPVRGQAAGEVGGSERLSRLRDQRRGPDCRQLVDEWLLPGARHRAHRCPNITLTGGKRAESPHRTVVGAPPAVLVLASLRRAANTCEAGREVSQTKPNPNRLGTALRRMAEDLVTERTRVVMLQREVRALKAQVAALEAQREETRIDDRPTLSA